MLLALFLASGHGMVANGPNTIRLLFTTPCTVMPLPSESRAVLALAERGRIAQLFS